MYPSVNDEPFEAGTVLLGKYRVDRTLGAGGMGVVIAATHVELEDRVAIKLLHDECASNTELVTRFLREARAAASLRSENVVRVFDVGRLESGAPYMVMELLEGCDLAAGPLGESLAAEDAVDYVVQACDAMHSAHSAGMVHRDLKPANLFLVVDEHNIPTIKVLDFGISKLKQAAQTDVKLTAAKSIMGSPPYMAPEQVRSARDVDARADIWSLGTILYELLSGRAPFEGDSVGAIFLSIATEEPPALPELRKGLDPELVKVVERCLSKDPAERFQTALALQAALLPFASIRSKAKMALRASSAPPTKQARSECVVVPPPTSTAWADVETGFSAEAPPHSSAARWLMALGGALLLAATVLVWLLLPDSSDQLTGPPAVSARAAAQATAPVLPASGVAAEHELAASLSAKPLPSNQPINDRDGGTFPPKVTQIQQPKLAEAQKPTLAPETRPARSQAGRPKARPAAANTASKKTSPSAKSEPVTPKPRRLPSNPLDIEFK